jgi:uncharacterized protein (DUF697 family)
MKTNTLRKTVKFIIDQNNKFVVWQTPNLPLVGWLLCLVISRLVPAGSVKAGFVDLSTAFLFTWAYLEITKGASYFRRALGVVIMVTILIGFFR